MDTAAAEAARAAAMERVELCPPCDDDANADDYGALDDDYSALERYARDDDSRYGRAAAVPPSSPGGSGLGVGGAFLWAPLLDSFVAWAVNGGDLPAHTQPVPLYGVDEPPCLIYDSTLGVAGTALSFHFPLHRFIAATAQKLCAARGGARDLVALLHELRTRSATGVMRVGASPPAGSPLEYEEEGLWAVVRSGWELAHTITPEHVERIASADGDDDDGDEALRGRGSGGEQVYAYHRSAAHVLMHAPLRLLGSVAAIGCNLWARNGSCMHEQCVNYLSVSPPLCRQFIDLDRLAVQLAMTAMRPLEALGSLFAAYAIHHAPALPARNLPHACTRQRCAALYQYDPPHACA